MARILVVDDDASMRHMLRRVLTGAGYEVELAGDGKEALDILNRRQFHLALVDVKMPRMDGLAFLARLTSDQAANGPAGGGGEPPLPVVMISAFGSVPDAVRAMKMGAADYLTKPFELDELLVVVARVLKERQALIENQYFKERERENLRFENMVGRSQAMRHVFRLIEQVAPTPSTVLITGPSGTGKELIARAIHARSPRAERAFVAVNCAALSETLLESELFGHERGAFTGAAEARPGRFEVADKGTIFLDEIGEIPKNVQVKLLRVLQERAFERVGSSKTLEVDVRVIAATNRDLEAAVRAGEFREDLFYRLNVFRIDVPPLRERPEDIPALVEHFVDKYNRVLGRRVTRIAGDAMARFEAYDYPGNVRELENIVERALIMTDGEELLAENVLVGRGAAGVPKNAGGVLGVSGAWDAECPEAAGKVGVVGGKAGAGVGDVVSLREMERILIERALAQTRGNRTHAAALLGISRQTLITKIAEYGLGQRAAVENERERRDERKDRDERSHRDERERS